MNHRCPPSVKSGTTNLFLFRWISSFFHESVMLNKILMLTSLSLIIKRKHSGSAYVMSLNSCWLLGSGTIVWVCSWNMNLLMLYSMSLTTSENECSHVSVLCIHKELNLDFRCSKISCMTITQLGPNEFLG